MKGTIFSVIREKKSISQCNILPSEQLPIIRQSSSTNKMKEYTATIQPIPIPPGVVSRNFILFLAISKSVSLTVESVVIYCQSYEMQSQAGFPDRCGECCYWSVSRQQRISNITMTAQTIGDDYMRLAHFFRRARCNKQIVQTITLQSLFICTIFLT